MAPSITAADKKWQQESDAYTLAEAAQIQANPARVRGAAVAAKKMLAEKQKQVQNLSKVANPAPKPSSRPAPKPRQKK